MDKIVLLEGLILIFCVIVSISVRNCITSMDISVKGLANTGPYDDLGKVGGIKLQLFLGLDALAEP